MMNKKKQTHFYMLITAILFIGVFPFVLDGLDPYIKAFCIAPFKYAICNHSFWS